MMTSYIAIVQKETESDFGVSFPDFPGCITAGTTLDDARRMASEALALHIEGLEADGERIPLPSNLDEVMADPANRSSAVFLVESPRQAVDLAAREA